MPGETHLAWAMACAVSVWLASVLLVVLFSIFSGRISLRGLLTERMTGAMSAFSRPQLLLATLAGIGAYVGMAFDRLGTARELPDVPAWLLAAIGGSQVLFLGGRGIAAFTSKFLPLGGRR